jgi:hypothetical protein
MAEYLPPEDPPAGFVAPGRDRRSVPAPHLLAAELDGWCDDLAQVSAHTAPVVARMRARARGLRGEGA